MNSLICSFCSIFIFISTVVGQNPERIRVKGTDLDYFREKQLYKYPSFIPGKVFFNDGDSAGGKLNYNYLDQRVEFLIKADTVGMAKDNNINFISIALDTFFYNNGFYEWMASGPTNRLSLKRTYKIVERHRLGAYSTGNATDRIESLDAVRDFSTHHLSVNEEYVFLKTTTFYLTNKIDNKFVELNKENVLDLFPAKSKMLEEYFAKNKVNLKKEEDVVDLFVFLNTHR